MGETSAIIQKKIFTDKFEIHQEFNWKENMSTPQEEFDLTSPEFIAELTPEQIAAAGEKKKYKNNSTYYMRTTGVKLGYSKPKLKNGELNADAKGAVWLELQLTALRKDKSQSTKLDTINFVKVFLYERLNVAAMTRAGYTPEQIKKVVEMQMPDTYDGFRYFAQAMFPERFGSYPLFNAESKTWSFEGKAISEATANEIKKTQKDKILAFQRELRANPKLVQGREAFWKVYYEETGKDENGQSTFGFFPQASFPSAKPHKDKNGVVAAVCDPDAD